uniref:Reverse transcriptase domain-containing protein n=1 Tax=Astyanax mexicanus TaxID=7994 RepID=A0A3B1JD36_ASTMX
MNKTTNQKISSQVPSAEGLNLQVCSCGWSKVTSIRGLRIHQGRMKCLENVRPGPRIDQYLLRDRSSQASEAQRQDSTHSPMSINIPVAEYAASTTSKNFEPSHVQPALEKNIQGHRPQVKWPKSNSKKEWETIDADLIKILEGTSGIVEKQLEKMGDLIYCYGAERYGTKETGKKDRRSITPPMSRRQKEIQLLVRERRELRKRWKKESPEERVGIDFLQADLKERLGKLRRAENLRTRRRRKEKARTAFYSDPFRFVKGLFTKEKSGSLMVHKQELEDHLKTAYTDNQRLEQREIPSDMPPMPQPRYQLDDSPPRWGEVVEAVKKARAASAPGPNGVPYRLYKNSPNVLRLLWKQMKVMWTKQTIPKAWRRAGGVLIPKEKDASNIGQFRQINLLNVEGKVFFSIVAKRLTKYLKENNMIDTSVQKAGIPGFSGCLEHISMIWHQIQSARKEGRDLHVLFLDLANAFGSIPHSLIWAAFDFFHIPNTITNMVRNYFQDLQFCIQTTEYTTSWQSLEVGIMAGCTISPLAFTMAMEVIIRASKWVVGGERLQSGHRLPPIRAYMDDLTTLTSTVACTKQLLGKLQDNIDWARMRFKPSKSRSLSISKGKLVDQRFHIKETPIPLVSELPVKSLGRWYNASLKDSDQADQLRKETIKGLASIDKTLLPGRLKLWCLQFGLLPRLMWPLTVYEVPMTKVEKLERTVSSYIKKWLGLPRCLSNINLFGHGALDLPISSLTEEFKCTKVRLNMTLTDSQDERIQLAAPRLATGKKWTPSEAIEQAKSALRHGDIVGQVQHGRGGIGLGTSRPTWHKATPTEKRKLVVAEVRHQEEANRRTKAVSQAKQGQWTSWEGLGQRKISWRDLWEMEGSQISFIVRATYDVLPTPTNLRQWFGEDPSCVLCQTPATLKHILTGCKTSLAQGRYTWRHNQVLRQLAIFLEGRRTSTNALPPSVPGRISSTPFVKAGQLPVKPAAKMEPTLLDSARDWRMQVDLDQRLVFPPEIVTTSLRPDLVLWSTAQKSVFIVELTVPWEGAVGEAYERKRLKYSDLKADAEQRGWRAQVLPIEVGCRGFVATSTTKLLKVMGVRGQAFQQAAKAISGAAERSSNWIWMKRKDCNWAAR